MANDFILILGAGLMQKPAIEAGKELGYKIALVDGNKNAMCVPLADIFSPIDLKDKDAILDFAKEIKKTHNLKAVFTAGTDFSAVVSFVAENLGLPSHSYQAACNASNKIIMRQCFEKANVPSPKFIEIHDDFLKNPDLQGLEFPLVVKPVDNMGARGCRMIRNADELIENGKIAIEYSRTKKAILEEYMEGMEFSIDALVFNNEVTITGFADRHIFYPPYFIEMGHTMPSVYEPTSEQWLELTKTFEKGIKALGLTHGVAKADIKLTPKGPMIGEIAGRLSGGYMSGWTYPYSSKVNLTKQALLLALNQIPTEVLEKREATKNQNIYNLPSKEVSAERAWISIPGKISEIFDASENLENHNIKDIFPRTKVGDKVNFPLNNVEKCGNVISNHENYKTAVDSAEEKISNLILKLEKNNQETLNFLQEDLNTEFPPSAFQLPSEIYKEIDNLPQNLENLQLPKSLEPYFDSVKDYNHRTIKKTLELFEKITKTDINTKIDFSDFKINFWHGLIRGGLQGILYLYENK